jgi:hypothetical protein
VPPVIFTSPMANVGTHHRKTSNAILGKRIMKLFLEDDGHGGYENVTI